MRNEQFLNNYKEAEKTYKKTRIEPVGESYREVCLSP